MKDIDFEREIISDIRHSADVDNYTNDQRKFLWSVAERLESLQAARDQPDSEQGGEWRHWYALSYRGTDLESGRHADAVTYIGFPDNALTLPRILHGKTGAGVSETAVLISATYCGYMTKTAFTGQPPKSKEGES